MLKREDIKDGNIVCDEEDNNYYYISNVGNAREKEDRGESSTPLDELSYSIIDIVTKEERDGICEHSGFTTSLSVASENDVEIYLSTIEADSIIELGEAKKQIAIINDAINRFNKYKLKK